MATAKLKTCIWRGGDVLPVPWVLCRGVACSWELRPSWFFLLVTFTGVKRNPHSPKIPVLVAIKGAVLALCFGRCSWDIVAQVYFICT